MAMVFSLEIYKMVANVFRLRTLEAVCDLSKVINRATETVYRQYETL